MKKIILFGASVAGIRAIEVLKQKDVQVDAKMFHFNEHIPCYKSLLPDFVKGQTGRGQLLYRDEGYYQSNAIDLIDKKVHRLNLKKKQIITDDKEKYDYDVLILAGTGQWIYPDIKGTNKTGVFNYRLFSHAEQILSCVPVIDTIVVSGADIPSIKMACAIRTKGCEVLLVVRDQRLLEQFVDEKSSVMIVDALEDSGVKVILDSAVSEIFGEKDVKAVRLSSGKVYSAQAVLFGEVQPDLRIFKDTGLMFQDKICTNDKLQTNFEAVYAVDELGSQGQADRHRPYDTYDKVMEAQGDLIAALVCENEADVELLCPVGTVQAGDIAITLVGNTQPGGASDIFSFRKEEGHIYRKLFVQNNILTGAFLVNSQDEADTFIKYVRAKMNLSENASLFDGYQSGESPSREAKAAQGAAEEEVTCPPGQEEGKEDSTEI